MAIILCGRCDTYLIYLVTKNTEATKIRIQLYEGNVNISVTQFGYLIRNHLDKKEHL